MLTGFFMMTFPGSLAGKAVVKNPPSMQETGVRSLGLEDSLEKGKANPLQYSGLENSMDCIVHEVTQSWTQLSNSQKNI